MVVSKTTKNVDTGAKIVITNIHTPPSIQHRVETNNTLIFRNSANQLI
jgi:hypothetical protein